MKLTSGRLVHRLESQPHAIEVRENRKFRWMHFDSPFFQTIIHKHKPYQLQLEHMPVMMGALQFLSYPKTILLGGLGGGAMVHYWQHYYPQLNITAVECNSDVIDMAQHYFALSRQSQTLSIQNDDIESYLQNNHNHFDAIMMDISYPDHIPEFYKSAHFYEQIYQHLTSHGILAINFVGSNWCELMSLLKSVQTSFQQRTLYLPIKRSQNHIIYAFQSKYCLNHIYSLIDEGILQKVQLDHYFGLCAKTIKNSR